jgi:hypothetical protein
MSDGEGGSELGWPRVLLGLAVVWLVFARSREAACCT